MSTPTPRQAAENAHFPFSQYLVDPARRLIFAAIPKNGCSDLKHWFLSLIEPQRLADPTLRLHAYCRAAHSLALLTPPHRDDLLRTSFTIAFVREPISRIVSAYVEKFVRPNPAELFEPATEVVAQIAPAHSDGITFREFVRYLETAPDDHLHSHWRPQSSFLHNVRIDLLGRMDALRPILDALGAELGMAPRAVTVRNATGYTEARNEPLADTPSATLHAMGLLPPASDLLDEDLRARLLARFRDDAMLFEGAADHAPAALLDRFRTHLAR